MERDLLVCLERDLLVCLERDLCDGDRDGDNRADDTLATAKEGCSRRPSDNAPTRSLSDKTSLMRSSSYNRAPFGNI